MFPMHFSRFGNEKAKTKEMIVDYKKRRTEHVPILIDGAVVEQVESFKFLGVHITNKLTWSKHTKTVVERARQNLFPLRRLKRYGMGPQILKRFYSCTIESILTGCITAWNGNCSASDRKALQRVVRMAQYITGAKLPAIQDLYTMWCQRKTLKIVKDSSHPSHRLLSLLPHGKRYWSAKSRFKRLLPPSYNTPPHTLLCCCYSLLLSMHSHFNNFTYMYIYLNYLD
uniref:Alkylated DNA repair protein AlkB homologue 8 N-terminal domain-containing protein n=1 Tax=Salmo trutta TaxID=8032 RepID=A0A673ZIN4_SALTR